MDLYIDESGDLGVTPRSSGYFVIAAAVIRDPVHVRKCFAKIRKHKLKRRFREIPEFKFNNSSHEIKRRVLECIAESDIDIWYALLRKNQLHEKLRNKPHIVYNYLVASLIAKIFLWYEPRNAFNVIVDKCLNGIHREDFDHYVGFKMLEQSEGDLEFPDYMTISHVDSRQEPCIQAADFISGAVYRKYQMDDAKYYAIIEEKCVKIFDYFNGPQK